MSSLTRVPISTILGDINVPPKIEESWSKNLPAEEAGRPVQELSRDNLIAMSLHRPSRRRFPQPQSEVKLVHANGGVSEAKIKQSHFFILSGNKLEYVGSKEVDVSKFTKDISGRFFREWVKKNFKNLSKKNIENIICWQDEMTVRDIAEIMGMTS